MIFKNQSTPESLLVQVTMFLPARKVVEPGATVPNGIVATSTAMLNVVDTVADAAAVVVWSADAPAINGKKATKVTAKNFLMPLLIIVSPEKEDTVVLEPSHGSEACKMQARGCVKGFYSSRRECTDSGTYAQTCGYGRGLELFFGLEVHYDIAF